MAKQSLCRSWALGFREGDAVIIGDNLPSSYGLTPGHVIALEPELVLPGYVPVQMDIGGKIVLVAADDLERDLQPTKCTPLRRKCGQWIWGDRELFAGDRVTIVNDPSQIWHVVCAFPEDIPDGHAPIEPETHDPDVKPVKPYTQEISNLIRVRKQYGKET